MSIKSKKIAWESWNVKQEEAGLAQDRLQEEFFEDISEDDDMDDISPANNIKSNYNFLEISNPNKTVFTPFGPYFADSLLKPTDRWDCWLGYTNFDITQDIMDILEEIEGVEALKILGRYTFCIGVGRLFNISDIRKDIEKALCEYTSDQILSIVDTETQQTIDNIKKQLVDKKFWSILIRENGNIDYTSSDTMDESYLERIQKFERLKSQEGGFILRSGE